MHRALSLRPAAPKDAKRIAALVNRCYRGDASRRGWTTEADLLDGDRTDEQEIASLISGDESTILLCLDGDELLGSVHLQRERHACYVGMLVVNPDLQGGGIGKWILEAAEDHARKTWSVDTMTMTVISARHELVAYYERRGYRRTGEVMPFTPDGRHGVPKVEGIDFALLEKKIARTDEQ